MKTRTACYHDTHTPGTCLLAVLMAACCIAFLAFPAMAIAGTTAYGRGYFEVLTSPDQDRNEWWSQVFKVDDEWVYCVEPHADFESGLTVNAQDPVAAGIWSQELTTRLALVSDFIWAGKFRAANGAMVTDNYYKFAVTQAFVWRLVANSYYGCNYEPGGARLVGPGDNSDEMWAWVDQNMTRYKGHANYYDAGNNQDVAAGFWLEPMLGQISLEKRSANPQITQGNAAYSLSGAVYGVFENRADAQSGDRSKAAYVGATGQKNADGSQTAGCFNTGMTLSSGTWWVRELSASPGYALDDTVYQVTVNPSEDAKVNAQKGYVEEAPAMATVSLWAAKADAQAGLENPQGSASLQGAEFTVSYYAGTYTAANLPSKATRTWVVRTDGDGHATVSDACKVSGDSYYRSGSGDIALPLGTISVVETKAPAGYLLDNGSGGSPKVYVANVVADASSPTGARVKPLNYSDTVSGTTAPVSPNSVKRIGLSVAKTDALLHAAQAEGDASLAGAVFSVVNASDNPVMVGGNMFAPGEECATATSAWVGSRCIATIDSKALPYGHYTIREKSAPTGYLVNSEWSARITVNADTPDGFVFDFAETPCENNPIRGGILVPKLDRELGRNLPLGAATLAGAQMEITLESAQPVMVGGVVFRKGDVVKTIVTGEDGCASTGSEDLPYATYSVRETKAPEGYLLNSAWRATVQVREQGCVYTTENVSDQVKRGDVHFNKVDGVSMGRIGPVAFLVTSVTTGESHVVVADENGTLDTSSQWAPHTRSTNGNDWAAAGGGDGEVDLESGVWFHGRADSETEPDNALGALPYDTYTFAELPGAPNEGYELVSFQVRVYRDGYKVDMGTVDDAPAVIPAIETELTGEDGTHLVSCEGRAVLTDTVYFEGLKPGATYRLHGTLMDKDTAQPITEGESAVQGEAVFRARAESGTAEVVFDIDAREHAGRSLVAFEKLYDEEGNLVADHEDIDDDDQSVMAPDIATTLSGADGAKSTVNADGLVKLTDRVDYRNLEPGRAYTLSAELHAKAPDGSDAGVVADADGNEVVSSVEFTPEASSGSMPVEFSFTADALQGIRVVAFERLFAAGTLLADHCDIEDEDQTATITPGPSIEKYVAKDVHKELADEGETFEYDILAYITADAQSAVIRDTLHANLNFACLAQDVRVSDMGEANNHLPNGAWSDASEEATVTTEGADITSGCTISIDGRGLSVSIPDAPALGLPGHWVRVTFAACVAVPEGYEEIRLNAPVLSDRDHLGIPNTASYTVDIVNPAYDPDDGESPDNPPTIPGHEGTSNTVTVKPPIEPAIEKYIDKDVHVDLEEARQTFTYDVMAYLAPDAVSATITDTLVDGIQLEGDIESVKMSDMGRENNHATNGVYSTAREDATVTAAGTDITGLCRISWDGRTIQAAIDDIPGNGLQNHWVRMTFSCSIAENIGHVTIDDNGPVLSDRTHAGIPNTPQYTMATADNPQAYSLTGNTVTVSPPTAPKESEPQTPEQRETPPQAEEPQTPSSSSSKHQAKSGSTYERTGNLIEDWWWVPIPVFVLLAAGCVSHELRNRRNRW